MLNVTGDVSETPLSEWLHACMRVNEISSCSVIPLSHSMCMGGVCLGTMYCHFLLHHPTAIQFQGINSSCYAGDRWRHEPCNWNCGLVVAHHSSCSLPCTYRRCLFSMHAIMTQLRNRYILYSGLQLRHWYNYMRLTLQVLLMIVHIYIHAWYISPSKYISAVLHLFHGCATKCADWRLLQGKVW